MSSKAHAAIVLAAGQGIRMESDRAKVLHEVGGHSMAEHVVRNVVRAGIDIVVVVGHQAVEVKAAVRGFIQVTCVEQHERLGTGHAAQQAMPFLRGTWSETVLVLAGDAPLLRPKTLRALADAHDVSSAVATVLTADLEDPAGYGRVVRDADGMLDRIVEQKDATPAEQSLHEINSGIYAFDLEALDQALQQVTNKNAQGEFYLTDTIGLLRRAGRPVAAVKAADPREILGINTVAQLAEVNDIYAARLAEDPSLAW